MRSKLSKKTNLMKALGLSLLLAVTLSGCGIARGESRATEVAWQAPAGIPTAPILAEEPGMNAATPNVLATALAAQPGTAVVQEPAPTGLPTETPTLLPLPSATITPTPTLHPMQIAAQRQRDYPGSEIVIEDTLEPGGNYARYYASYLSDGLKIYALLTIPYGEMPAGGWPAIVFNHGYIPPTQYRTTERYINYVDRLAKAGYIVFRIDYRGHDRSEGEPSGAYGSPDYTSDVLNAVAALQRFPQANPDRIGMWGHSMGGYLTLRAMVISPEIKAGVIWAGVVGSYSDLVYNWRRGTGPTPTPPSSSRRWRNMWIEEFGTPEENPDFWNSISANSYLSDLSGPVQLHHGTSDTSVPLAFSETLSQQLLAAGKTGELYTYERDDHNLATYFTLAMDRTVEFFDLYLK